MHLLLLASYSTSAPNGINASFAILKNCSPKGIPIIVIQYRHPVTAFTTAIGSPQISSHSIFARSEGAPPPKVTSFQKGKNARLANLKHCNPKGIPITVMQHKHPAIIQNKPLRNPPKINHIKFPKHPIVVPPIPCYPL